jgi:citronellol/citronellal dehydrogenase
MPELAGKGVIVTGASRGLGKAIALTFAREGARVALLARTEEPNPRIAGTIHETAEAIRKAGGEALPIRCNVGSPEDSEAAVQSTLAEFGRIDILVHNAAANFPGSAIEIDPGRWDILMNVNPRALFLLTKGALPSLQAQGGHIISISPKLQTEIGSAAPFSLSKQLQTRLALGLAKELTEQGIAVNCLWPDGQRTSEGTMLMRGGYTNGMLDTQLFADAALAMVLKDPRSYSGRTLLDTEVLKEEGVADFSQYEPSDEVKAIRFR